MIRSRFRPQTTVVVLLTCAVWAHLSHASVFCHETGVRLEVLGSGELSLDNVRSSESYLIWHENRSRILVNPGPGTYLRFKMSGAKFEQLDAIVVTQVGLEHTGDIPHLLAASMRVERTEPLPIFGPAGDDTHPSIVQVIERSIGEHGAYPELREMLTYKDPAGYRLRIREVNLPNRKRWGKFAKDDLKLSAVAVHSGLEPSLAWRVNIGDKRVVFAGELSNQRDIVREFAKDANILVFTHRLPAGSRGDRTLLQITPEAIGRIASMANVEVVLLGGRGWRTFGREYGTRETIQKNYSGPQIYANEEECWRV